MMSLIIPVYRNEDAIPQLLEALGKLDQALDDQLEVVFVDDGSPDRSFPLLQRLVPACPFQTVLIRHSRNFGSFAAVRTGLERASGDFFAVMAADLQDPPELMLQFHSELRSGAEVVLGVREERNDPLLKRISSRFFWYLYRLLVQPEMPRGGVDIFGCSRNVRDRLISFREANSTLVGLLIWLGFERRMVPYVRRPRPYGTSGWNFSRRLRYMLDSVFAFSDLPLRLMVLIGALGVGVSVVFGAAVLVARLNHAVPIPGYAATILVILFFGGLNLVFLGLVGAYVWRAFENTKSRPLSCVQAEEKFPGHGVGA